jgi:hypothetical protein
LEQRRMDDISSFLGGKLSKSEVTRTLGVSYTSVKKWWRAYATLGRRLAP